MPKSRTLLRASGLTRNCAHLIRPLAASLINVLLESPNMSNIWSAVPHSGTPIIPGLAVRSFETLFGCSYRVDSNQGQRKNEIFALKFVFIVP